MAVDIDGVISLFGSPVLWAAPTAADVPTGNSRGPAADRAPAGSVHTIEGIPHFLSHTAAACLVKLTTDFDLVWASGWEERADEHLPYLLGLPRGVPHLSFARSPGRGNAHWKLSAIDEYAGSRPLAWVDDALSEACHAWARERPAPTMLVQTAPERGLTADETAALVAWAHDLGDRAGPSDGR